MKKSTLLKNAASGLMLAIATTLLLISAPAYGQLAECDSDVPFIHIDLSSNPDSTYLSPEIIRAGQCCGGAQNDNYVSFLITLHPAVTMVEIGIAPGYADPFGSGNYNIITGGDSVTPGTCGPDIPGGSSVCLAGSGPHRITYHKPGKNKVKFYVKQTPSPIVPPIEEVRIGCSETLDIYGLDSIVINSVNSSTGNTTPGAYNSLLSCTNCNSPLFTPGIATPAWIDYQICGSTQGSSCGTFASCDTIRVYIYPELNVSISPDPASYCAGSGGVTLTATGSGGLTPYSYEWTNSGNAVVSTDSFYHATSQGSYTVRVTDQLSGNGCQDAQKTISVNEGNPAAVDAGDDDTLCSTNASIPLKGTAQNGTSVIWTGGTGTYNPSNTTLAPSYTPSNAELNAGFVTLILSSTNGNCGTSSDTVTFVFSDTLQPNLTATPIICYGGTSVLSLNPSGGIAPYTYEWSNGATGSTTTVPDGSYSVTVTDGAGCSGTTSITVTEPAPIQFSFVSTDTSSDSVCDGSSTITVTGGVGPYTIHWENGFNGPTSNNLCDGFNSVYVTDSLGCYVAGGGVVKNPYCSSFDVTATHTTPLCFGDSNATATALPTGGTGPYTYSWDTLGIQNNQTATGLGVGTYTVVVTDDSACVASTTITITQPTILTSTMTHTDVSSAGASDGTATVNVSGGLQPYTYTWDTSPTQSTQTATGLSATTYHVEVRDQNNCLLLDTVEIGEPNCGNFFVAVATTNVNCNGQNSGTATLTVAHGTLPYSIQWSSGQTNVSSVSGLAAGSYSVTITDSTNCTSTKSFIISQPATLSFGLTATNITCNGAANGSIDLSVSGGTFPYTYQWYKGTTLIATHEDISGLTPGTYSIVVTDANNCSDSNSIGITQPTAISVTSVVTDVTCKGSTDGALNATVTGGTAPYTYAWTGPASFTSNTQDISNLSPGFYHLGVTDANGCSPLVHQTYVNTPDSVKIVSVIVPCPMPGSSTIEVEVDSIHGGLETIYQVSFNNGGSFQVPGDYTSNLPIGNSYQLIARDMNHCVSSPYTLIIDDAVVSDSIVFDPCVAPGATSVPVAMYPSGGDGGNYQVSIDSGATFSGAGVYTFNLTPGQTYSIVMRDSSGCDSEVTTLVIPTTLTANSAATIQVSCAGESDGAINLTVNGGTQPYTYSWSGPGSFTSSGEDPSGLQAGTYTVVVTDDEGCTAADTIVLTTETDTTSPSITCPSNVTVSNNAGMCGAIVTYSTPLGTDNCSGVTTTMTSGLASGSFFPVGTTWVTFVATDSTGNTDTCSFSVTVNDTTQPVFSGCPGNITVSDDGLNCSNIVSWIPPTATDNCDTTVTITASHNPGTSFPVGTTTVTYTATDDDQNSVICSFTVTVNDTTSPVLATCPGNMTVNGGGAQCGANVAWTAPTATDLCGVVSTTSTHTSGSFFAIGIHTVTYTFTDAQNNSVNCVFTVTVIDTTTPVFTTCPANITVSNTSTACGANVTWSVPTVTDQCGTTTVTTTNNPGTFFGVGTHTVTYTAMDPQGNSATCSFTVTVNDTTSPLVVNCPSNITVASSTGQCGATASWSAPSAQDNCGTTTTTASHASGSFFAVGTTPVTYTFTDASGNTSTCSFNVTVTDNVAPVVAGCPSNIQIFSSTTQCGATASWTAPTATDNCGTVTSSSTHTSGAFFNVGTTAVTYTFTDSIGNSATCSFNVIVTDDKAPVVAACPANITSTTSTGQCGTNVTWTAPTATDNCTAVTTTSSHTSGSFFNTGTTAVTYTFTDGNGNSSVCSFNVTVNDNQNPQITCPSNISQCNPTVTYATPTATDNCGVGSVVLLSGLGSGSVFPVGTTTETYQVTDVNGNTSTCQFTVTILSDPTITLVASNVSCFGLNDGSIDATITGATNPISYSWSHGPTTEDVSGLQPGTYSLTVTDVNGCTSSVASATISQPSQLLLSQVHSNISCSGANDGSIDVTVTGGNAPYSYAWSNGGTTQDLSSLPPGTYVLTVTDDEGCTQQTSVIIETPMPLLVSATTVSSTCQSTDGQIDITVEGGTSPYSYNWSNGASTQDLSNISAGTYTVQITDANGCMISYTDSVESVNDISFTATVRDIQCFGGENGSITIHPESPTYTYSWSNGATTSMIQGLSAGSYTVTVTDTNSCSSVKTYAITESPQLVATITSPLHGLTHISLYDGTDGFIETTVTGGTTPYAYAWSNGMTTPSISGLSAGTYAVVITDANGCTVTLNIELTQPSPLELPSAFSPNGDGRNDRFIIRGIENYPVNEFIVYNRWGNVVFNRSGYENDWNGSNNSGAELPDGTYFVLFRINDSDGFLYNGFVDLRRD